MQNERLHHSAVPCSTFDIQCSCVPTLESGNDKILSMMDYLGGEMNGRSSSSDTLKRLREKAEEVLKDKGSERPDIDEKDLVRLTHEIEVYQVELELQNEELRRAKAELETSRDEFFDLYESAPVAYVTLNEKGIIERANQAAYRMLKGLEKYLLLGSSFLLWIHKEDISVYSSLMEKLALKRASGPVELRLQGNEGPVNVLLEATAKIDGEEGLKSWRLALVNITERKRMEEELRRSRDELELRVKERTAELEKANAKLSEYNRRLEELNKELHDFVFVASHDLQEPLRKVRTFGEMLVARSGDALDETSRDYLMRMESAVARMQDLINSLLAYSRVSTRAEPPKTTDLGKSVEVALSNLEIMIRETNARVEIGDLPKIKADRVQMIQLFQNLIGNALKFHRKDNTPHVKVYGRVGDEGRAYEMFVEDNGIGFEDKYLDRIFLPFHRLHGRSSDYEGAGMGLAICKKIVERHGGTITARSESGKGSTFMIALPVSPPGSEHAKEG